MMRALSCCSFACLRISVICSTAVVTNTVSPPDALILASCAEKSTAFGSIVSRAPTSTPAALNILPNSRAAPMPEVVVGVEHVGSLDAKRLDERRERLGLHLRGRADTEDPGIAGRCNL